MMAGRGFRVSSKPLGVGDLIALHLLGNLISGLIGALPVGFGRCGGKGDGSRICLPTGGTY